MQANQQALLRDNSGTCLAVHLSCPYIQDHLGSQDYEQHIHYLKEFFSQEHVAAVLKADPQIVGLYKGCEEEVAILFSLDIECGGAGTEDGIA